MAGLADKHPTSSSEVSLPRGLLVGVRMIPIGASPLLDRERDVTARSNGNRVVWVAIHAGRREDTMPVDGQGLRQGVDKAG